ncbi:expansin EXLX1 family cellulose-binding protein [Plantactinospora siamensis]|uniref:Expansin EXLX1 family cellulose-binding protein n=1 Tax=Plantactinospora siamensis TaxID=555372 RepID=A0ABV6NUL9_9ACTN
MTSTATDPPVPPAGRPGHRRPRWPGRWWVAGGVTVLAAVVGLAMAVQAGGAPACAAPPTGGTVHSGKATFYDSAGAGGNCSYPAAPADHRYVALGPSEYSAGAACGGYLDVTGPKGTIRVLIMDQCPECEPGHLDLSAEAFARIADPVQGIVPVRYRAVVNPPLPGPLTFRLKEGSSQWWFAVQIGNHGNPLRSVEVRQGASGSWRTTERQDYNYWLIGAGAGAGPFSIRVTDVYGHRVVATGIRMAPGQVQRSSVRMYGGSTAARSAPARRPAPSRSPSAGPARSGSAAPSPTAVPTAVPAGAPATVEAAPPASALPVRAGCG